MSYEIFLVHCDVRKSVSHRLVVAAGLARRFGTRLVGLHVRDARLLRGQLSDGRLPQAYDEDVKTDETEASEAFPKATTGKELATERVSMSRNPYRSSRKEIKDQPRWRSVVT